MEKEKIKTIEDFFKFIGTPTEEVSYHHDEKRGHVFVVKSAEFEKVNAGKDDVARDLVYLLKRIFNKNTVSGEEVYKCTIGHFSFPDSFAVSETYYEGWLGRQSYGYPSLFIPS